MPKIKLKPNLSGIEIGIGNVLDLKIKPGEIVDVAEELSREILSLGYFDNVDELSIDQDEEKEEITGEEITGNESSEVLSSEPA